MEEEEERAQKTVEAKELARKTMEAITLAKKMSESESEAAGDNGEQDGDAENRDSESLEVAEKAGNTVVVHQKVCLSFPLSSG